MRIILLFFIFVLGVSLTTSLFGKEIKQKENILNEAIKPNHDVKPDTEFVNRKKELIIKDFETLFEVYDRETTIIYNYRYWALALLGIYFTFLYTVRPTGFLITYVPGLLIIITTVLLEVSERMVMQNLLKNVRDIETIFMIKNTEQFNNEVIKYEFRDLQDKKYELVPFDEKLNSYWHASISAKIFWWSLFLIIICAVFIKNYRISNIDQPVNPIKKIVYRKTDKKKRGK